MGGDRQRENNAAGGNPPNAGTDAAAALGAQELHLRLTLHIEFVEICSWHADC